MKSIKEISASIDAQFAELERTLPARRKAQTESEQGFVYREACDLGKWIARCVRATVPFVPATLIADFDLDDLLKLVDGESSLETLRDWKAARARLAEEFVKAPRSMWRWSCCASMETKWAAGEGQKPESVLASNQSNLAGVDDPRFHGIGYDLWMSGVDRMGIYIRPWVDAKIIDGFPVEFRVFANSTGTMCANYYLQRDLPDEYRRHAIHAMILSDKIRAQSPTLNCSMDFILTPDDQLVFLEGGPGWGMNAHPCALHPQEPFEDGKISLSAKWDWR